MCFKKRDVKHGLGLQGRIVAGLDARELRWWRKSDARLSSVASVGLRLLQVRRSFGYLPGVGVSPGCRALKGKRIFPGRRRKASSRYYRLNPTSR